MIDWITACIAIPEPARMVDWATRAGYTLHARPGGEVERMVDKWLPIAGSYDAGVRARIGTAGLWLSGNPTKLLTGQNLDGPEDLPELLGRMAAVVCSAIGLPAGYATLAARLTRVDVTRSIDLGAVERVREALRVIALGAKARHQGRSHTAYSTVYFGQRSRRHSIKIYAKGDELRQHTPTGLPDDVMRAVSDQAAGLLRIEVTLRSLELQAAGLADAARWDNEHIPGLVWSSYWERVEMSSGVALTPIEALALPRRLRQSYELWRRGGDCSELLSRAAYYRHRRELLSATDGKVDLAMLQPTVERADLDTTGIVAQLRSMRHWTASGRLAEWISETAA